MHKVKTNSRRKSIYLSIYLISNTIVSWGTIYYYGSEQLSEFQAGPIILVTYIASIGIFIIDIVMISRFTDAAN